MANRNFNRKQALEKEVKEIYAAVSVTEDSAPSSPSWGAAASFSVLASSTITNTGSSVITGDLGLSPGTSVTGFPPGIVSGVQHIADSQASNAQTSANAAYVDLQSRTGAINESGIDLGTLTLNAGVYKYNTSAQLTGTLTLDAQGNPNAVWIFQIGSTLTTASASVVNIINGGSSKNVFWAVGSSATLGTTTNFKGNIIALASITANTGATISGKAIALTAAVTLDTNTVSGISIPKFTLLNGYGVSSFTRNSAGNYTLVLEDKYMKLMQCELVIESALAQNRVSQLISDSVNSNKSISMRIMENGQEKDPSAPSKLYIAMNLKNSSVGRAE